MAFKTLPKDEWKMDKDGTEIEARQKKGGCYLNRLCQISDYTLNSRSKLNQYSSFCHFKKARPCENLARIKAEMPTLIHAQIEQSQRGIWMRDSCCGKTTNTQLHKERWPQNGELQTSNNIICTEPNTKKQHLCGERERNHRRWELTWIHLSGTAMVRR